MNYFVYIYSSENGVPYYVGKGSKKRIFMRHDVPVPSNQFVQYFPFATEHEAWDTEIELIALFGRRQDGGTLMNLSTGGRSGTAGVVLTAAQKERRSVSAINNIRTHGHPQLGRRGAASHNSLTYEITTPDGEVSTVTGLTHYCRQHGLHPSAMVKVAKGKQKQHKGYRCTKM